MFFVVVELLENSFFASHHANLEGVGGAAADRAQTNARATILVRYTVMVDNYRVTRDLQNSIELIDSSTPYQIKYNRTVNKRRTQLQINSYYANMPQNKECV